MNYEYIWTERGMDRDNRRRLNDKCTRYISLLCTGWNEIFNCTGFVVVFFYQKLLELVCPWILIHRSLVIVFPRVHSSPGLIASFFPNLYAS